MKKINFAFFILLILLFSCESKPKYSGPSPVDNMVRDMANEKTFSIILHDMQVDDKSGKDVYQHKYKVTKNPMDSTSKATVTNWTNVDEVFFAENLDNMGLELASKSPDGKIHKVPSPPGFNGYVGNERYGNWRNDNNGNSFWAFYGQYMFMSTMFNMMSRPTYRSTYTGYRSYRNSPSTRNAPYYGSGGRNSYGTNSPATRASNPSFYQRKQQQSKLSSFRQKVTSNPSRYSRSSSSRTDRTSSRTSGSSSRSRGGSFGK